MLYLTAPNFTGFMLCPTTQVNPNHRGVIIHRCICMSARRPADGAPLERPDVASTQPVQPHTAVMRAIWARGSPEQWSFHIAFPALYLAEHWRRHLGQNQRLKNTRATLGPHRLDKNIATGNCYFQLGLNQARGLDRFNSANYEPTIWS